MKLIILKSLKFVPFCGKIVKVSYNLAPLPYLCVSVLMLVFECKRLCYLRLQTFCMLTDIYYIQRDRDIENERDIEREREIERDRESVCTFFCVK